MQRSILYVESDDHGGNTRGLLSPKTLLLDDSDLDTQEPVYYSPKLRKWQEYLWKLREYNLGRLVKLANGDQIDYLHMGDITQGNKYASDWVSTRIGDQFIIALANHRPIMELPNLAHARYTDGTDSHVFGGATSEEVVVNQLKSEYKNIDIKSVSHGLVDFGGMTVDYAHHGPGPGSRAWLDGNVASWYLRDEMIKELLRGKKPAKLYLRAHYHAWVKAIWNIAIDDADYTSIMCLAPSLCGLGAYGQQATKSVSRITNGALAFEIVDGEILRIHRWTKTLDIRKREVL